MNFTNLETNLIYIENLFSYLEFKKAGIFLDDHNHLHALAKGTRPQAGAIDTRLHIQVNYLLFGDPHCKL